MATDASIYRSVLEASLNTLAALVQTGQPLAGWHVDLCKSPTYVSAIHSLPQIVIAPNRTLAEIPLKLTFGKQVALGYEVVVGTFVDSQWKIDQLWKRLAAREVIRNALWDVGLAEGVSGGYDANYEPSFGEGEAPPAGVDSSWQKVVLVVKTTRTSGT